MPGEEPPLQALQGSLLLGRHEGEAGGSQGLGVGATWPGPSLGASMVPLPFVAAPQPFPGSHVAGGSQWEVVGCEGVSLAWQVRHVTSLVVSVSPHARLRRPPRLLETSPRYRVVSSKNSSKRVCKRQGHCTCHPTSKWWLLVVVPLKCLSGRSVGIRTQSVPPAFHWSLRGVSFSLPLIEEAGRSVVAECVPKMSFTHPSVPAARKLLALEDCSGLGHIGVPGTLQPLVRVSEIFQLLPGSWSGPASLTPQPARPFSSSRGPVSLRAANSAALVKSLSAACPRAALVATR